MDESRGARRPLTALQAHEVLTSPTDGPPRSVYRACSSCAALVARDDLIRHGRWHEALAVLAGRALGLSS